MLSMTPVTAPARDCGPAAAKAADADKNRLAIEAASTPDKFKVTGRSIGVLVVSGHHTAARPVRASNWFWQEQATLALGVLLIGAKLRVKSLRRASPSAQAELSWAGHDQSVHLPNR